MTKIVVEARNTDGLHDRPAYFFIEAANKFKSSIWLQDENNRRVNAKSMLGVLTLGIVCGTQFKIIADGPDEEKAVQVLKELIESEFDATKVHEITKGLFDS